MVALRCVAFGCFVFVYAFGFFFLSVFLSFFSFFLFFLFVFAGHLEVREAVSFLFPFLLSVSFALRTQIEAETVGSGTVTDTASCPR